MKSLIGKLSVGSALIGLTMVTAPAASALTLTGDTGTTYQVELITGSFSDPTVQKRIVNSSWFDNPGSADDVEANNAFSDVVSGIDSFEEFSEFFAQADAPEMGSWRTNIIIVEELWTREIGIGTRVEFSTRFPGRVFMLSGFGWTQTTNTSETKSHWLVEVIPTPGAVIPSLFGMGLSAIRKGRVTPSEEA